MNKLTVTSLDRLSEGETALVSRITHANDGMRRRLQDLGLIEGTLVECVRRSPLGDPAAYRIRSTLIALRREDSSAIAIVPCQTPQSQPSPAVIAAGEVTG